MTYFVAALQITCSELCLCLCPVPCRRLQSGQLCRSADSAMLNKARSDSITAHALISSDTANPGITVWIVASASLESPHIAYQCVLASSRLIAWTVRVDAVRVFVRSTLTRTVAHADEAASSFRT